MRLYVTPCNSLQSDWKIVRVQDGTTVRSGANLTPLEEYQYATMSSYSPTLSELPVKRELGPPMIDEVNTLIPSS